MPHPAPLRLLLALSLAVVPAFAAKPKAVPNDAAPQLISTQGGGPKWKNVAELQSFAAKGDPQACFELADRTLEGDGVPKDAAKAIPLYETAAKGGIANAWFRLGKIYHDGLTGTPDYGWALEYFGNAARARVAEAQHNIGAMLVSARGVKRDYIEGLAWLIVAKKSGAPSDAEAQVRTRLSRRPADITAAETRAAEITGDLLHATVRATLTGKTTRPPEAPPAPPAAAVTKPVIIAPAPETIPPVKIVVPLPPALSPGKP